MRDYSIEKGGPAGLYLVNHLFDQRHGLATIGYAKKTEDGKWSSQCHGVNLEGTTKSRTEAADKVFDYWKNNFSKEALTELYGTRTKGGHSIEFIHAHPDWVVATVTKFEDGKRIRSTSSWKNGKYSVADDVNGKRDDSYDLVKVSPQVKAVPVASDVPDSSEPPKKSKSMRP